MSYIWESQNWPDFYYDETAVNAVKDRLYTQKLMTDSAFSVVDEQMLRSLQVKAVSNDIIASLSIEDETIDAESVLSSVSKHLDVFYNGKGRDDVYATAIFSIVSDAIENTSAMTHDRLFDWQKQLFIHKAGFRPKGLGSYRIGPEFILKASGKKTEIIYEAVPAQAVRSEMERLLAYVNENTKQDPFIKAAVTSLWFVIIHPFEDGNGRISRSLADYVLARSLHDGFRTFSISGSILRKRREYYDEIQAVSTGDSLDVTPWVVWFLETVTESIQESREVLRRTLAVTSFMKSLDPSEYNSRELSMLYRLADGSFYGKLTNEKWMKITKCSNAAAFRDIQHLVAQGFLIPSGDSGRNTGYYFDSDKI